MRVLLRLVALIAYVVGGYLIGFMVGRLLLIPVAAVAHLDKTFESLVPIAAGVIGTVSGLGWFNARFAHPAARGGVHGSAYFASPDDFRVMLEIMQKTTCAGGLIRRAANRHLGKSEREAAGVLSSAQRHTHFLDSVRINQTMVSSDFRFADLKETKATVFLVLPPERLDAYSRWLRLMVAQAIHDLARSPARPAAPVLFLLDEFAALGRLEPVERAFGLMAGYGLQLWPILQDMHQLWSTYGERAGTFVSNAGLVQIFNVADVETASWVSKSIGATTMSYQTTGTSTSRGAMQFFETKSSSTSTHLSRRELMTPDEIMRLDSSLEILLRQGAAPAIAAKVRYYDGPEFRGLFTAASV